jgi:hypothetical protein
MMLGVTTLDRAWSKMWGVAVGISLISCPVPLVPEIQSTVPEDKINFLFNVHYTDSLKYCMVNVDLFRAPRPKLCYTP